MGERGPVQSTRSRPRYSPSLVRTVTPAASTTWSRYSARTSSAPPRPGALEPDVEDPAVVEHHAVVEHLVLVVGAHEDEPVGPEGHRVVEPVVADAIAVGVPGGRGVPEGLTLEDQHTRILGELHGERKPGRARADDDDVVGSHSNSVLVARPDGNQARHAEPRAAPSGVSRPFDSAARSGLKSLQRLGENVFHPRRETRRRAGSSGPRLERAGDRRAERSFAGAVGGSAQKVPRATLPAARRLATSSSARVLR